MLDLIGLKTAITLHLDVTGEPTAELAGCSLKLIDCLDELSRGHNPQLTIDRLAFALTAAAAGHWVAALERSSGGDFTAVRLACVASGGRVEQQRLLQALCELAKSINKSVVPATLFRDLIYAT